MSLPEGQREFSVAVFKPHHKFAVRPEDARLSETDGRFDAPESILTMVPLVRRSLRLELRNHDGTPLVARVFGSLADGCSWSGVPLGTSDARGRFDLEEFYPEEFSDIGVERPGSFEWLFDPRKERWPGRRVFYLKP